MNVMCENHTQKQAKVVCHHCGKALCESIPLPPTGKLTKEQLCGYLINDNAFAAPADYVVRANHCESCLSNYHPEYSQTLQRLKASL